MIWAFEKHGQRLRCEIRRAPDGQDYEFVVCEGDGAEQVEQFDDPTIMIARSVEFFRRLLDDGWQSPNHDR